MKKGQKPKESKQVAAFRKLVMEVGKVLQKSSYRIRSGDVAMRIANNNEGELSVRILDEDRRESTCGSFQQACEALFPPPLTRVKTIMREK